MNEEKVRFVCCDGSEFWGTDYGRDEMCVADPLRDDFLISYDTGSECPDDIIKYKRFLRHKVVYGSAYEEEVVSVEFWEYGREKPKLIFDIDARKRRRPA